MIAKELLLSQAGVRRVWVMIASETFQEKVVILCRTTTFSTIVATLWVEVAVSGAV
jgi:hypothetical protein